MFWSAKRRLLRSEASNDAHRPAPVHRRLGPLASLRWRPRLQHLSQPALNSTPVKPRRLSVPVWMRRHWLRRHPVSTHEDGVDARILDNSALLDESGRTRKYTPSRIQVAAQQRRRAQQLHEGPADAEEAPTDGVATAADHSVQASQPARRQYQLGSAVPVHQSDLEKTGAAHPRVAASHPRVDVLDNAWKDP